jgi:hypothetical protein
MPHAGDSRANSAGPGRGQVRNSRRAVKPGVVPEQHVSMQHRGRCDACYSEAVDNPTGDNEPELIPCLVAPIADAKEILSACEDADIVAAIARDVCCAKGGSGCGCAPKMKLLVARDDVPKVARLLQSRWDNLLAREAIDEGDAASPATAGDDPPCPACGTAAPLVEGACSDCGLQLE